MKRILLFTFFAVFMLAVTAASYGQSGYVNAETDNQRRLERADSLYSVLDARASEIREDYKQAEEEYKSSRDRYNEAKKAYKEAASAAQDAKKSLNMEKKAQKARMKADKAKEAASN